MARTMTITVRFFASLRERVGRSEAAIETTVPLTTAQVWTQAVGGQPLPLNTLIAVNMEYADLGHAVHDGDEVAFFPPVTGGDHEG